MAAAPGISSLTSGWDPSRIYGRMWMYGGTVDCSSYNNSNAGAFTASQCIWSPLVSSYNAQVYNYIKSVSDADSTGAVAGMHLCPRPAYLC